MGTWHSMPTRNGGRVATRTARAARSFATGGGRRRPSRLMSRICVSAVLAVCLIAPAAPVVAQSWKGSAEDAGLSVGGAYDGLSFRCLGNGRAAMIFSGFPGRLQPGERYTVAISVDGVAQLFRARANQAAADAFSLVDDGPLTAYAELISRLRQGRAAEISGPGGHYTVTLHGSGKALESFMMGCGR